MSDLTRNGFRNPNRPGKIDDLCFVRQSKLNQLAAFLFKESSQGRTVDRKKLYLFFFDELYEGGHLQARKYRQMMDLHDFLVINLQLKLTPAANDGHHIWLDGNQEDITAIVPTRFRLFNDAKASPQLIIAPQLETKKEEVLVTNTKEWIGGNEGENLYFRLQENRNEKHSTEGCHFAVIVSYVNSKFTQELPPGAKLATRENIKNFLKSLMFDKGFVKITLRNDSIGKKDRYTNAIIQLLEGVTEEEFTAYVKEWFNLAPYKVRKGVLNEKTSEVIKVRRAKWSTMKQKLQEKFSDRVEAAKKLEETANSTRPSLAAKVSASITETEKELELSEVLGALAENSEELTTIVNETTTPEPVVITQDETTTSGTIKVSGSDIDFLKEAKRITEKGYFHQLRNPKDAQHLAELIDMAQKVNQFIKEG